MHKRLLTIAMIVAFCGTAFGQMMDNPTTESGRVLKNAAGSIVIDWENLLLTNGEWQVSNDANVGAEIVNWRTLTNAIASIPAGSVVWGNITGTLANQTDLNIEFTNRYTKAEADSAFIEDSEKAAANGVATLDADVKIPFTQIPAIAITDVYVVDTTNDMAAISNALMGDVAIVLDTPNFGTNANSYIATNEVLPSTFDTWVIIEKPLESVFSVNGKSGTVTLFATDLSDFQTQVSNNTLVAGAVQTEVDPVWVAASGSYYLASVVDSLLEGYSNGVINEATIGWTAADLANSNGITAWANATFLTTGSSPTMDAGTDWAFALASVTNIADSGTEIVNWQTMTNKVESYGFLTASGVSGAQTNLTDGLSIAKQALYITNIAGTVYCETELIGGGDMTYMFGGSFYTLDCTTGSGIGGRARSGALAIGTDINPVLSYIYVVPDGAAAILTNSTTMPTGQFAWMARVYLQSAATTLTDGPLALQRTTEALAHDGRGAIAYDRERIRQEPASYFDGVDFTVTDDDSGNITWANTSGIVYQMHRQTFPSFSDPAEIIVINDPTTPYRVITNFNQITQDALGSPIGNGRIFGVHIYGNAASGNDGTSRLYLTLPYSTYNASSDALSDAQNFDVNFLPQGLRGGGFSIARVVIKNQSGTYELISGGDQDFRGFAINATSGGGAGSGASQVSFQDSVFNVYDDGDPTKRMFFEASGITTGTDRTYTAPDASGTLPLLNLAQIWTAEQTFGLASVTNWADSGTEIVNWQTMTNWVTGQNFADKDLYNVFTGASNEFVNAAYFTEIYLNGTLLDDIVGVTNNPPGFLYSDADTNVGWYASIAAFETDPVWVAESNNYYTITEVDAKSYVTNNTPSVTLDAPFTIRKDATNSITFDFDAFGSNRWSAAQVIGTDTNVTFISPEL